ARLLQCRKQPGQTGYFLILSPYITYTVRCRLSSGRFVNASFFAGFYAPAVIPWPSLTTPFQLAGQ
ncbi:hypothetical protein, partial [Erwinia amylovora]|uniref:hypothetical protein n=1 Tax=Erwinia amylovora TaxID=552 RepID=UPI00196A4112